MTATGASVRRLTPVLNRTEAIVHERLAKTCEPYGSDVYPKMRLADVLPITGSGIQDEQFSFALKSHFDFVVVDGKNVPLFAVEFDGPLHGDQKQMARDRLKDDLCTFFELPLLRVRGAHLEVYRNYDLLSWIVEQWFLREAFDEAQRNGHVPYDEDFDPFLIISTAPMPTDVADVEEYLKQPRFPLWLCLDAQLALGKLHRSGRVRDPYPSFEIGIDDQGAYHALFWLETSDDDFAVVATGARSQRFPISVPDLLTQVGVVKIHDQANAILAGRAIPWRRDKLEARLAAHKRFQLACAFGRSRGAG